jgi:hypothetical protein
MNYRPAGLLASKCVLRAWAIRWVTLGAGTRAKDRERAGHLGAVPAAFGSSCIRREERR